MYTRRLCLGLLLAVGVLAGQEPATTLRGKALAGYVFTEAQDGYQVVFSLAELDPTFLDNVILRAGTANGMPFFGAQGCFRPLAPGDNPGARSLKMLAKRER